MFMCDKHYSCCDHQYWDNWDQVEQEAKECGHLIEVVPVVRCKDCKHRAEYPKELGDAYLTCGLEWGISGALDPMDFCSYGERKES